MNFLSTALPRRFWSKCTPEPMSERARASNAALGLPTSDGALGCLDKAVCRARVADLIIRERTPGTIAARKVTS